MSDNSKQLKKSPLSVGIPNLNLPSLDTLALANLVPMVDLVPMMDAAYSREMLANLEAYMLSAMAPVLELFRDIDTHDLILGPLHRLPSSLIESGWLPFHEVVIGPDDALAEYWSEGDSGMVKAVDASLKRRLFDDVNISLRHHYLMSAVEAYESGNYTASYLTSSAAIESARFVLVDPNKRTVERLLDKIPGVEHIRDSISSKDEALLHLLSSTVIEHFEGSSNNKKWRRQDSDLEKEEFPITVRNKVAHGYMKEPVTKIEAAKMLSCVLFVTEFFMPPESA